jgi:O-antigen/teichoic acid export membrane protein
MKILTEERFGKQLMSIKRNTLINLVGAMAPMFISLMIVPLYLRLVGEARFGVLVLVWLFVGYFEFFDFGIGKATANHMARLRDAPISAREEAFWTGALINGALGLLGGLVLLAAGHYAVDAYFGDKLSGELDEEIRRALPWMALAVPVGTVSAVGVAALEAREQFLTLNALQVLVTALIQLSPLLVAWWRGPALDGLIAAIVICRVGANLPVFLACRRHVPLRGRPRFRKSLAAPLFRYGGWVTVTAVVGPILVSVDRLLIGSQLGLSAVAHYTVPYNLVTKFQILPASLMRTLFPRFSSLESEECAPIARQAVFALAAITLPLTVAAVLVMKPFLRVWIGAQFAEVAAPVGEILLIGVWINSLAWVPVVMLQGQGRPAIVAKLHVLELIPYIAILWMGVARGGLQGAAWAWVLRVGVDALLMFWVSGLWARVFSALWTGIALIAMIQLALYLTAEMPMIRGIAATALLIAAVLYSLHAAANDLRLILARVVPLVSSRLAAMRK